MHAVTAGVTGATWEACDELPSPRVGLEGLGVAPACTRAPRGGVLAKELCGAPGPCDPFPHVADRQVGGARPQEPPAGGPQLWGGTWASALLFLKQKGCEHWHPPLLWGGDCSPGPGTRDQGPRKAPGPQMAPF